MKYSPERISHLAHGILDTLVGKKSLEVADKTLMLREIKEELTAIFADDERVDGLIREKLAKQKKIPGSKEWQILYEKYHAEESAKRGW